MKNLKNQKGITLVALVVTIIVLLILAGVSLSLVAGSNGILTKASTSVDKTTAASAKEQVDLLIAEKVADFYEDKYANATSTITQDTAGAYIATLLGNGMPTTDYFAKSEGNTVSVYVGNAVAGTAIATGTLDSETGKVTWN